MQKLISILFVYWPFIIGVMVSAVLYISHKPIWVSLLTLGIGAAATYLWLKAFNGMHFV